MSAVTKKGITCRHRVRHENSAGVSDLTDTTLTVRATAGEILRPLACAVYDQTGADKGYFWFDITAADLTALGLTAIVTPENLTINATLQNSDATIFDSASAVLVVVP